MVNSTGGETSSLRNELMNGQAGGKIELDDTGFFFRVIATYNIWEKAIGRVLG